MATTTSTKAASFAIAAKPGIPASSVRQRPGEARAAEHAGEDADQGDAHLHRRQEALRVLGEGDRRRGAGAAGALQRQQPPPAGGHDGQLAHGKGAVQGDEQQEDDDLETDGHGGSPIAAVYPRWLPRGSRSGGRPRAMTSPRPALRPGRRAEVVRDDTPDPSPVRLLGYAGLFPFAAAAALAFSGRRPGARRAVGPRRLRRGHPELPRRRPLGLGPARSPEEAHAAWPRLGLGVLPALVGGWRCCCRRAGLPCSPPACWPLPRPKRAPRGDCAARLPPAPLAAEPRSGRVPPARRPQRAAPG